MRLGNWLRLHIGYRAIYASAIHYHMKRLSSVASATPSATHCNVAKFEQKRKGAVDLVTHSLQTFPKDELLLCFNGGKDCTVLVDILDKCCKQLGLSPVAALYFKSQASFDEVEQFVELCTAQYNIKLHKYMGDIKTALCRVVTDLPTVRAMFLGCRRSDPLCQHFTAMMPTDADWPPLLRIFPLLEWSYHDIWYYLREHQVRYCKLYDQGYTSLGERTNTSTNPKLLSFSAEKQEFIYRPAYELQDVDMERANRLERTKEILSETKNKKIF